MPAAAAVRCHCELNRDGDRAWTVSSEASATCARWGARNHAAALGWRLRKGRRPAQRRCAWSGKLGKEKKGGKKEKDGRQTPRGDPPSKEHMIWKDAGVGTGPIPQPRRPLPILPHPLPPSNVPVATVDSPTPPRLKAGRSRRGRQRRLHRQLSGGGGGASGGSRARAPRGHPLYQLLSHPPRRA